MFARTTTVVLLAALLAGCKAGTSLHGAADIAQWTPTLAATADTGSGDKFDVVGTGGVVEDDAFWSFDVALQFGRAGKSGMKAQTLNIGYWGHRYSGTTDFSASPVDFAGKTLDGPTTTSMDLNLYKFTYGEPQAGSGGGSSRTEGTIGLHYLDFSVKANDTGISPATARYDGNAPMFVIGWKISYSDRAMVYFFSVEGMDLDVVSLGNVKGDVLDYSAGVRWSVGSSAALSLGWRSYEANLDNRGEQMKIKMEGLFFSLFLMW